MTSEELAQAVAALRRTEPEIFEAVLQQGVALERARVVAHLDLGASCHSHGQALEAIRSGAEMTAERTTGYLTAAMNHADRYARQRETDKADALVTRVIGAAGEGELDLGDKVVTQLRPKANPLVRP